MNGNGEVLKVLRGMWGEMKTLNGRVNGTNERLEALRGDVEALRGDVEGLRGDVGELRGDVQTLGRRIDNVLLGAHGDGTLSLRRVTRPNGTRASDANAPAAGRLADRRNPQRAGGRPHAVSSGEPKLRLGPGLDGGQVQRVERAERSGKGSTARRRTSADSSTKECVRAGRAPRLRSVRPRVDATHVSYSIRRLESGSRQIAGSASPASNWAGRPTSGNQRSPDRDQLGEKIA